MSHIFYLVSFIFVLSSCKQRRDQSELQGNRDIPMSAEEKVTKGFTNKPWYLLHENTKEEFRRCPEEIYLKWVMKGDNRLEIQEKLDNGKFVRAFDRAPFFSFDRWDCNTINMLPVQGMKICHRTTVKGTRMTHVVTDSAKGGVFVWKVQVGVPYNTNRATQELDFVSKSLLKYSFDIEGHPKLGYRCEYIREKPTQDKR